MMETKNEYIESGVYNEPLFDDVADDINFTGAISRSAITITTISEDE